MKTDSLKKLITFLGFVLGFYLVAVIMQPLFFASRFGAESSIAGVDVGFTSAETAKSRVEAAYNDYKDTKITVGEGTVVAGELITSADLDKTVDEALLREQRGYFNFSKITGQKHVLNLTYNDAGISRLLLATYDDTSVAPVDAVIRLTGAQKVLPEKNGQHLLLVESRQAIREQLADLRTDIALRLETQPPTLTAMEASSLVADAEAKVSQPVTILGDGVKYEISAIELAKWLRITTAKPKTLIALENFLPPVSEYYYLDSNMVFRYVDTLAKGIDKRAQNAKLAPVAGKVVVISPDIMGRTVDRRDAISQIQLAVAKGNPVSLKITTVEPEIRADNLAGLGLSELVATGWSDFTGSPANRTVNVAVGASKFNGVLIKPGEEFSFNKALGPVDASTGYLPELVILADKTVPEFGGGLCQVSSTAFRAALNAGLPILERHAHAYPIGYYLPYGVDATIYLPSPDLRFANDTGKYIFIQTRIEGRKLYFDFYGTKKPVKITFSGNDKATGAVENVEKVKSTLTDLGIRGKNSFTAVFYRHIYDASGKLLDNDKFTSKYDSPDKYPH